MRILKAIIISIFIFCVIPNVFAATVGNSLNTDVPSRSAVLRQDAVEDALDEYEQSVIIKASVDAEIVFDKELDSSLELTSAELEGQWNMFKLGMTIFNRIEPYVKVGSSNLQTSWKLDGGKIEVEAESGFAIGGGVKAVLLDLDEYGICVTLDGQYRVTEPDVDKITIGSVNKIDKGADFKVEEWQAALLLSKKYEIPLRWQSIFVVPYIGATFSESIVDVRFTDPVNPTADYTLYKAGNDTKCGFVTGVDILPSLLSPFSYNIELRLANETALSLGGTMKF